MGIVLLLVVAFVVWHFIPQRDPNQPSPRFRKEMRAVGSDPNWSRFIEEHCESPAETAFLRAMIEAYDLTPVGGSLAGKGLRLDFQVEEGGYRTDFLADRWLVIEIDGAAYHSSAEAIARDRVRDEYFESLGYSVVRIPAKVVFNRPKEAVQRVRSALHKGKRTRPMPVQKSGWQRLSDTFVSISDGLEEINKSAARAREVGPALESANRAWTNQRDFIRMIFERSQESIDRRNKTDGMTADELAQFETDEFLQNIHLSDIKALRYRHTSRFYVPFPAAPPPHSNTEYDAVIQQGYERICQERDEFILKQKRLLDADAELSAEVRNQLKEANCEKYVSLLWGDADPRIATVTLSSKDDHDQAGDTIKAALNSVRFR